MCTLLYGQRRDFQGLCLYPPARRAEPILRDKPQTSLVYKHRVCFLLVPHVHQGSGASLLLWPFPPGPWGRGQPVSGHRWLSWWGKRFLYQHQMPWLRDDTYRFHSELTGQNGLHLPPHPKEDRKSKSTSRLEGGKPENVANDPTSHHDALESPCLAQRDG